MTTAVIPFFLTLVAATFFVPQGRAVSAPAGAPEFIETGPAATTFAMTEAEYRRFVDEHGKTDPDFVAVQKKPDGLSARARFGINLILRGKNLSWMLDGDDTEGYVLYADWNGNGDLTDDTPLRLERVDGKYTVRIQRDERDADLTYPVSIKLVLDWVAPPGKTERQLAMRRYDRTTRRGELMVADSRRPLVFQLTGSAGFYAQGFNVVAFDLDGNGVFDRDTEIFRVSEKYVNVGDTTYEFAVDAHGRSLTLTPLAEHRPARVALTVGAPAPDFTFVDLDGRSRKLSDYRGKVVLLNFWGAWCAPCVVAAPKLVATYEKFHDRGFEILGIDTIDTREKVLAFIDTHKMRWAETMEPEKGPIQTLYRVTGFPTYLIVGPDGTIKAAATGSNMDLERELQPLLGVK